MAAPVRTTYMGKLHENLCKVMLEALKGEPLFDKKGKPVLRDGEPVMILPRAATLKEIREFLKDNGIDQEPIEGTAIHDVKEKYLTYEDEPLLIPERESNP